MTSNEKLQNLMELESKSNEDSNVSIPASPLPSSSASPKEQLDSCLSNLFRGPTTSIETAFSIILQMMQEQEKENKQLKENHEKLLRTNEELHDTIRKEYKLSQDKLLEQVGEECETLRQKSKVELGVIGRDHTNLLAALDEVKKDHQNAETDLYRLKEEMKVMAYNLQLTPAEYEEEDGESESIIDEVEDNKEDEIVEQVEIPKDEVDSVSRDDTTDEGSAIESKSNDEDNCDGDNDSGGEILSNTDNEESSKEAEDLQPTEIDVSNEGEKNVSIHSHQEDSVEVASTDKTEENNVYNSTQNSGNTITTSKTNDNKSKGGNVGTKREKPQNPWKKAVRKVSLLGKKLQVHETLAARLDRLEGDKEELKLAVIEIKSMISCMMHPVTNNVEIDKFDDTDVQERINNIEAFLHGFGGFDHNFANPENESMLDDEEESDFISHIEDDMRSAIVSVLSGDEDSEDGKKSIDSGSKIVVHDNVSSSNKQNKDQSCEENPENIDTQLQINTETHDTEGNNQVTEDRSIETVSKGQNLEENEGVDGSINSDVKGNGGAGSSIKSDVQENEGAGVSSINSDTKENDQNQSGKVKQGDDSGSSTISAERILQIDSKDTDSKEGQSEDDEAKQGHNSNPSAVTSTAPPISQISDKTVSDKTVDAEGDQNQDENTNMDNDSEFDSSTVGALPLSHISSPTRGTRSSKKKNLKKVISFHRPQGLLQHLLDQEKFFKAEIANLSLSLRQMHNDLTARVRRPSMEKYFSDHYVAPKTKQKEQQVEKPGEPSDNIAEELNELRNILFQISCEIDDKVSKESLCKNLEISECGGDKAKDEEDNSTNSDEIAVSRFKSHVMEQLEHLNRQKVDKNTLSDRVEEIKDHFNGSLNVQEADMVERMSQLQMDLENYKHLQMINGQGNDEDPLDVDLDERIRVLADTMESNLQEAISSRLASLKTVEDELEKLTSQLAEKPSQDQINEMLRDLENAVSERGSSDEMFQMLLDNMKSEMNQRMTRTEVLSLVKHLLDGAKQDITTNQGSQLMVGHKAYYKCLSCNRTHPQGVNRHLARKVNHNALPVSRGLLPAVFPHARCDSGYSLPSLLPPRGGNRGLSPISTYSQARSQRKALENSRVSRGRPSPIDKRRILQRRSR